MLKLKYNDEDTFYTITFKKVNFNIVQLTGDFPHRRSGFLIYKDHLVLGDYSDYTTIYRELEHGVQFSNDNSVYEEPSSFPFSPVKPMEPTLEELKQSKKAEINSACESAITGGVDIPLSFGETEHFDLKDRDQLNLLWKQVEAASGKDPIDYHSEDADAANCRYYSNADMRKIIEAAIGHINTHQTYCIHFKAWIDACEDREELAQMHYGMDIPNYTGDIPMCRI